MIITILLHHIIYFILEVEEDHCCHHHHQRRVQVHILISKLLIIRHSVLLSREKQGYSCEVVDLYLTWEWIKSYSFRGKKLTAFKYFYKFHVPIDFCS